MINIVDNNIEKKDKIEELDDYIEKKLLEIGQPVYLNIYHLSFVNYFVQLFGFGFFHSSIEINEKEFSYSATNDEYSGIFSNLIEDSNLILKEKIYLGNTFYNNNEINEILLLNTPYWLGKSYDPFLKNCNHFTKFFSKLLIEKENIINHYPDYVNRITEYGFFFNCFYSSIKRLYGNTVFNPNSGNNIEYISLPRNNISIKNELSFNLDRFSFHRIDTEFNLMFKGHGSQPFYFEKNNSLNNDTKNNNFEISKDNYSDQPSLKRRYSISDQKCFFEKIMKYNFFLNSIFYNGNNPILKKLVKADNYFANKKLTQALNIYQEILKEVDLEKNENLENEFNNIFSFNNHKYILNQNDNIKHLLFKLKILHCIFYIFFKNNLINDQELVSNTIFKLNKNDYFSLFYKAYIKFVERNIPECVEIIKNGIEICNDNQFKKKFRQFYILIEQLEF